MAKKTMAGTTKESGEKQGDGIIRRASSAIGRIFGKRQQQAAAPKPAPGDRTRPQAAQQARPTRRPSDIELDVLNRTYTPAETSGKAGFRSDGADHQRDQEFATGVSDERWNAEDHFTNKSGDSRIGTHGRTYEPGEASRRPNDH